VAATIALVPIIPCSRVAHVHGPAAPLAAQECHLAYARFRRADVFVPLYDPAVLERIPGGRIAEA